MSAKPTTVRHPISALAAIALLPMIFGGCSIDVEEPTPGDLLGEQDDDDGSSDPDEPTELCADGEEMATWFDDADGDGYGDSATAVAACEAPERHVDNDSDCDDGREGVHPLAVEVCGDQLDNDCAGGDACAAALSAQWAFATADGVAVPDESGNNLPANLANGAAIAGQALVLDGVDDYAVVDHDPVFELASGTMSLWFQPQATGIDQGLLSKDSSGYDAGGHLTISVTGTDQVMVRVQSDVAEYYAKDPDALEIGVWHHVAVAFGAEGLSLYIDGQVVASDPYTGGIEANQEPIAIGGNSSNSGDGVVTPVNGFADGALSDVRIHSRVLTAAEIGELAAVTVPAN